MKSMKDERSDFARSAVLGVGSHSLPDRQRRDLISASGTLFEDPACPASWEGKLNKLMKLNCYTSGKAVMC